MQILKQSYFRFGPSEGVTTNWESHRTRSFRAEWRVGFSWTFYSGNGYGLDGLPWCISHYAFHMVRWHIPFAISGQSFSAPEATLSFEPKLSCPYNVPFYISFATGTLQCTFVQKRNQTKMKFQIMSTSGEMFLQQLAVSGFRYPSALTLKQGEVVTWFSH